MRNDKQKAIELRISGASYNEISKSLGVAKSTLAFWLKNSIISRNIKNKNISKSKQIWAQNITQYNKQRAQRAHLAAQQLQEQAKKEILPLDHTQLKLIGSALYWAEGYNRAKWTPIFCNTDPAMVQLMMRFFREICKIPEDHFRPQVQVHVNISSKKAEEYWAGVTGLSKKQFMKPLLQKQRHHTMKKPYHLLPYGTFRIKIADARVLYKLKGWINGLRLYTQ